MSELQIGLLAIGAVVVAAVLVYNRIQEGRARREAERNFRSGHEDVLIGQPAVAQDGEAGGDASHEAPRHVPRDVAPSEPAQPDPAIDYIIEFSSRDPVAHDALRDQWSAIERRHSRRAL